MAEPARRLDDSEHEVYDTSGTAPSSPKPDLKALEGGGETTEPKQGHIQEVDSDNPVSHVYKSESELAKMKPSVGGVMKFASTNRGKISIGGVAAGMITLLVIGFFALLPFKILHIVNNLQNKFMATSENAVTKESDVLFSNYVKHYVLPGITNCKGTVDKSCTPKKVAGNGLVSKLYKGWSNARLENTLADKYGLEFQYKKSTKHYYMKTTDTIGDGVDLGTETSSDGFIKSNGGLDDYLAKSSDPEFKQVSRAQVRQAVKDTLNQETKFKQVMYRFKVGRLLEEKYGIKRCIVACSLQDNFSEWKDQKKLAAKALLAQRVLEPRGQMLGVILECLTDPKCDPTHVDTSGACTVDVDCEAGGEDRSDSEKQIQSKLDALAAKYGTEDVLKLYNDLEEKGFTRFTIEQVLSSLLGEDAATAAGETADKALPIVGWVNLAAQIVGNIDNAPKKIQKLTYIANTSTMVATYAMYRTYADEIKFGHDDSTIVGAFTDSLGPSPNAKMGGTAEAEQTAAYGRLLGDGKNSGSNDYKCNDGNPVPAGQAACSEMQVNNIGHIASAIQSFKASAGPAFGLISGLASIWNNTAGGLISSFLNLFGGLVNKVIPVLGETVGAVVGKVAGPLISAVVDYIIPPIASDNMSGGRVFDLMAGGADVSGNDYAHHGLGGQVLSDNQVAAVLNEQNQEDAVHQSQKSYFARMFDTNSENSLVTRFAMAMPTNLADLRNSAASIFISPFKHLSSLISLGQAQAATAGDPFGITQYGYSVNDKAFTTDPESFWDNNCSSDGTAIDPALPINKAYHESVTTNPDTQMPENDTTDPCYLIQAAVGSDGAVYDSSLLTADDTGGQ